MTSRDQTINKIRQLPESLVQEVSDFIDALLVKQSRTLPERVVQVEEEQQLVEMGLDDYLSNLNDYEERLARGEIQW